MSPGALPLYGVTHLVRATRRSATNLEELRTGLANAPPDSLFYHAVQYRLRDAASEESAPDDVSAWVRGVVQHVETAERLSFAVAHAGTAPDPLRAALVGVLEAIPERTRLVADCPEGGAFEFLTCETVVLPHGAPADTPSDLLEALATADASVWFWHFVEEPWRTGAPPTPIGWLREQGEDKLARLLREETAVGAPLLALRRRVVGRWRRSRVTRIVTQPTPTTDADRRESERRAVEGLVRRVRGERERP